VRALPALRPAADLIDVPRTRRLYVNRNLRLESVRAIGFDMDHTLAGYRAVPFETLAFDQAKVKLYALGYPRETLALEYDPGFVIRGLIVDKRRGNILKMDRHHYVVQAYHGTRKLPPEMRKALYARRRLRITGTTFVAVDTPFSVPEIGLYAQIVDLMDAREGRPDYRRLYDQVRAAVDEAHADGSIKDVIAQAPLRYLEVDEALPETLDRMRAHGLKLFLLTNSEASYTALVMDRLLSGRRRSRPHWTDYFDLIVVRAAKPGFFTRRGPLQALAAQALGAPRERRPRFVYSGGGAGALERALGVAGDAILYFGDHTYGDIMRSKRVGGWRTAMIVRPLEEEIEQLEAVRGSLRRLEQLERRADRLIAERDFYERLLEGEVPRPAGSRPRGAEAPAPSRREVCAALERLRGEIRVAGEHLAELEAAIDAHFNPHWGSIFRAGREISHFGQQIGRFACVYTSRVSNFLNYPMDKYFVTTHESLPHER
jgi:HAD superfamily 5'-nucleotidase-like hydrolase